MFLFLHATPAHQPAQKNGKTLMNSSRCNDSQQTVKDNNLKTKIFLKKYKTNIGI